MDTPVEKLLAEWTGCAERYAQSAERAAEVSKGMPDAVAKFMGSFTPEESAVNKAAVRRRFFVMATSMESEAANAARYAEVIREIANCPEFFG